MPMPSAEAPTVVKATNPATSAALKVFFIVSVLSSQALCGEERLAPAFVAAALQLSSNAAKAPRFRRIFAIAAKPWLTNA
jgi:hypothetical protein